MNMATAFPTNVRWAPEPGPDRAGDATDAAVPTPATVNVLRIQRYAINDGPGIRTTVFFKGCPLRCKWCHNPEAMHPESQLMFNDGLCVACGRCVDACSNGVHDVAGGAHRMDFTRCARCGLCVDACPQDALSLHGDVLPLSSVMEVIRKDQAYYDESGGGVTLSGGEPLVQPEAAKGLITTCRQEGIRVFLDTCGFVSARVFREVASLADGILFDLKIMAEERHRHYTGVGNEVIKENFRIACGLGAKLRVRSIVIPGVNEDVGHREAMVTFLRACGFSGAIDLLPYHSYARGKYAHLGLDYELADLVPPTAEQMAALRDFYQAHGFSVSTQ
jgi:pyruvate formate lyase activating enzyme